MSNIPNDDLFGDTTMTFGEHLEELRGTLYRSLIGVVIGSLIGFFFAKHVVRVIQEPLKEALDTYNLNIAVEDVLAQYPEGAPPEVLALIKHEGMVPTSVRIEAEAIVAGLKEADPDQFADLHYQPYRFVAKDVVDGQFQQFAASLLADGQRTGTPSHRIWQLLDERQRATLAQIAKKEKTSATTNEKAILDILNKVVEKPEIHASTEFASIDGSPKQVVEYFNPIAWANQWLGTKDRHEEALIVTVARLRAEAAASNKDNTPFDPDKSRRLNKLLLASAFPNVIEAPRRLVVDLPSWKLTDARVQTLNAHEAFMIWLRASLICGLVLSSPWVFWQIWHFVAAGLYPHEKHYVHIYLPFSLLLFFAGIALAFFFVFEPVLNFLFSFNKLMDIDPDPRISEWLSFVLFLPLGFGIAFQLPLVMLFLNRIGIFTVEAYLEKWRIAILVIFVISMLLTPADPISMLLMAVPLTALYFLGIVLCRWMPRGRNPFSEGYEP